MLSHPRAGAVIYVVGGAGGGHHGHYQLPTTSHWGACGNVIAGNGLLVQTVNSMVRSQIVGPIVIFYKNTN